MSYQCAVNTSTDYYSGTSNSEKIALKKKNTGFRFAQTAGGGFEYIKTLPPDTVKSLKKQLLLWPSSDLGNTLRLVTVPKASNSVTDFKARKAATSNKLPPDFIAVEWIGAKPPDVKKYVESYRTAFDTRGDDLTKADLLRYLSWFGITLSNNSQKSKISTAINKYLTKATEFPKGPNNIEYWPAAFFLRVPPFRDISS